MSGLPWRSQWVYGTEGSEIIWRPYLPVGLWDREVGTVGGRRRSQTGIMAAYVVRRDNLLLVPVRIVEGEWEGLYNLIVWGQSGATFLWYPDPDANAAEFYEVDLEAPAAGSSFRPVRSEQYPRAHELALTIRRTDGLPWTLTRYAGGARAWT